MINLTSLPLISAALCAVVVALILQRLFPIDTATGRDARAMQTMLQPDPATQSPALPFWRALLVPLYPLTKRVPGANVVGTARQLLWVQLDGHWRGWTAEEVWAVRLAGAAVGLLLGLLQPPGLMRFLPAIILFLLVGQRLSSAYDQATRRVRRELPEFTQAIALQVALGKSVVEALTNLREADTILSRYFGYIMATCPVGPVAVPLFNVQSHTTEPGWIVQQAQISGMREVSQLAGRLEKIARRGVAMDLLLNDIADLTASDYNAEVAARAQQLDSQLSVPLTLGLFFPYVALLILPFISDLGNLFR
ncbi:hypothetical protein PLCT2_02532 [Planctomycetaceae bacterium]|nr:hypothetical protein PLCT2_02532 [Planctomycetaceae bacterium]